MRVGRKRGDFVEDDSASATEFETAEFAIHCTREGAAFVAEEFAFDERWWKRSAVDFEKRCVAARTELMNEAREVILARAGFASDEECGGGSGDFFREIEQAARSGVFGDPGEAVGHGSIVARVPNHGVRGLADVAEEATNPDCHGDRSACPSPGRDEIPRSKAK